MTPAILVKGLAGVLKTIGLNSLRMLLTRVVVMWGLRAWARSTEATWDDNAVELGQALFDNDVEKAIKYAQLVVDELTQKKQINK
jgi:hypothetical protein